MSGRRRSSGGSFPRSTPKKRGGRGGGGGRGGKRGYPNSFESNDLSDLLGSSPSFRKNKNRRRHTIGGNEDAALFAEQFRNINKDTSNHSHGNGKDKKGRGGASGGRGRGRGGGGGRGGSRGGGRGGSRGGRGRGGFGGRGGGSNFNNNVHDSFQSGDDYVSFMNVPFHQIDRRGWQGQDYADYWKRKAQMKGSKPRNEVQTVHYTWNYKDSDIDINKNVTERIKDGKMETNERMVINISDDDDEEDLEGFDDDEDVDDDDNDDDDGDEDELFDDDDLAKLRMGLQIDDDSDDSEDDEDDSEMDEDDDDDDDDEDDFEDYKFTKNPSKYREDKYINSDSDEEDEEDDDDENEDEGDDINRNKDELDEEILDYMENMDDFNASSFSLRENFSDNEDPDVKELELDNIAMKNKMNFFHGMNESEKKTKKEEKRARRLSISNKLDESGEGLNVGSLGSGKKNMKSPNRAFIDQSEVKDFTKFQENLANLLSDTHHLSRLSKPPSLQERLDRRHSIENRKVNKRERRMKKMMNEGVALEEHEIHRINKVLIDFVTDTSLEEIPFPPMNRLQRIQFHKLAQNYGLKTKSRGGGKHRFPTAYKTENTYLAPTESINATIRNFTSERRENIHIEITKKTVKVVGQTAKPLGESNLGNQLLKKLGWAGTGGLGPQGQGIDKPVEVFIKNNKQGLGF